MPELSRVFPLLTLLLLLAGPAGNAQPAGRLTRWVDPFLGTGGHGHTYPGATVPFGMVQLSPDNGRGGWDWCSGYHYADSTIVGFSHTHLSGTGCADLGDIALMPATSPAALGSAHRSRFSHRQESAEPGYYSVRLLDQDIGVELTASARAGFHRYTFPRSDSAVILIDLDRGQDDTPRGARLEVRDSMLVTGYRFSKGWAADQRVYFAARFSRPFLIWAADTGGGPQTGVRAVQGKSVRGRLDFGPGAPGGQILVKVGISSVSEQNALGNLDVEIAGWDFDRVRASASELWERQLSRVRVEAPREETRQVFYTALYHTLLAPTVFSDVDGSYRGGDGQVHRLEGGPYYSTYSLWDTYRAAHPLYTIIAPERVDGMMASMLAFARESGYLPVWQLAANETNTMVGYHAVPPLADAYLKGFRGFDAGQALAAMTRSATRDHRGLRYYAPWRDSGDGSERAPLMYVPADREKESVSKTLEYAVDDFCIGAMAGAMGRREEASLYDRRAQSYRNIFDSATGFFRGRKADGSWVSPFDPRFSTEKQPEYTEGNAWQYLWLVPQDVPGLIGLLGGAGTFDQMLDSLFQQSSNLEGTGAPPDVSGLIGLYAHGNEPSHHISYLYDYGGEPWKTQAMVQRIMRELYRTGPDGLCGNEDCGQMSAWYVFSALGFYPVTPAGGVYAIGSPALRKAVISTARGKTFTVEAPGLSPANIYIQSAALNGRPLAGPWITHADLTAGGTLTLVMGPEPNRQWGAGAPPPALPAPR